MSNEHLETGGESQVPEPMPSSHVEERWTLERLNEYFANNDSCLHADHVDGDLTTLYITWTDFMGDIGPEDRRHPYMVLSKLGDDNDLYRTAYAHCCLPWGYISALEELYKHDPRKAQSYALIEWGWLESVTKTSALLAKFGLAIEADGSICGGSVVAVTHVPTDSTESPEVSA